MDEGIAAASSLPKHDEHFIDGTGLSQSLLERNLIRYFGPTATCRRVSRGVRHICS